MPYTANDGRYDSMPYRRCGRSGLKLSAISFGLWHNLGGTVPIERSREMLLAAFDAGITHFDLANNYGPPPGSAEESFGRVINGDLAPYRDEIIVSTKAGYYMWPGPYGEWGSRKSLVSSLDQSLKRMGIDYVDIFYHHRPDPDTPLEETMSALADIVRQGKALYVGVSNYSPERIAEAHGILESMGLPLLISQARYSMFNRVFEQGEQATLLEKGIGGIAFCPLAQGLLTGRYLDGIPKDSRAAGPSAFLGADAVTEDRIRRARALSEIATERGQSLAQFALAWALSNPAMTSVIIGASRVEQLRENAAAVTGLAISDGEAARVEEILRGNEPFY